MQAGLQFHPSMFTGLPRMWQPARTVNRETLSTMATVIVAVVALGAFVRGEIGDVRTEIHDVRDEIGDVRTEVAELRAEVRTEIADLRDDIADVRDDIADLRERMVRVEVLLGISRAAAREPVAEAGDGASR